MKPNIEIDRHPSIVWEMTRACALQCNGCPAGAQPLRSVRELSTVDGYRTIDQIAGLCPSRFVMTGGDPLRRDDFYEARALAMHGDLFASDPLCAYDPDAVRSH